LPSSEAALREWVRSHHVTWERAPHFELADDGRKVHVGYDVTLFALHPPPLHDCPGCDECLRIHQGLYDVASTALRNLRPEGGLAIGPFTAAFAMRAESAWAPEVELDVEVYQPGPVAESDADEDACIHAMEDGLRRLGARPNRWAR
jgi:hypothetical protein